METLGMSNTVVSLSRSNFFATAVKHQPMLLSVSCTKDGDRTANNDASDSLKIFKNTIFIPIGPINLMSVQSSKKRDYVPKISPDSDSNVCDEMTEQEDGF
ncbi:hypothetical protein ZOSMA_268G00050 [Zostera marina]|uniref:Uncharacterized protein n=1 Tax=Zostera marina TaxID=29655 RepID=A0A0K9PEP8_ZOSMR|nr:hypothetical protein ZOSMA_268G00050 [Zostera marina]